MRDPILKRFTVNGSGAFPFDLLRVDRCWPATAADAGHIGPSGADSVSRTVTLETAAKYSPDRRRWLSLGWRVLD